MAIKEQNTVSLLASEAEFLEISNVRVLGISALHRNMEWALGQSDRDILDPMSLRARVESTVWEGKPVCLFAITVQKIRSNSQILCATSVSGLFRCRNAATSLEEPEPLRPYFQDHTLAPAMQLLSEIFLNATCRRSKPVDNFYLPQNMLPPLLVLPQRQCRKRRHADHSDDHPCDQDAEVTAQVVLGAEDDGACALDLEFCVSRCFFFLLHAHKSFGRDGMDTVSMDGRIEVESIGIGLD